MSKMGLHDPFGLLNLSYGQMKGRESNCQFDSWPLKVKNRPDFLAWMWHVTYYWKSFFEGYNFALNITSIRGWHTKLRAPKFVGVPILGISGFQFGRPGTKWHLGAGPEPGTDNTIRGKVVASPKFGPWWVLWVLWVHVCPWFVHAPKMVQPRTNQLVVWFVQVRVNNWVVCQSS
jgi:hypothetical protein